METQTQPLVRLDDVTFGYGREVVLDHVSLDICSGDFLAIIGPNGGGKTTLVKIALGLLRPWSGTVRLRLPGRRGAMGYVPQFSTFDKNFPLLVRDVVRMGRLGLRGPWHRHTAEDEAAVADSLERFGLTRMSRIHIGDLSGGQLQRVLVARALVSDPDILFLDEPLASIDAEFREVLLQTLQELNRRIPVVVITHDLTPLAGIVRQIACLNRRLYYHPHGKLTASMLEEVYGCPVELVTHGVPHRVLPEHES